MQTSTTWRNSCCLLVGITITSILSLSLADVQLNDNNVDANYMIVNFNQIEFPMAIGKCNPFNVLGQGGYQMAQCIDSNTLEYTTYSESTCTSTPTSTTIFNGSIQTGTGTYLDFNCDGEDAYASIEWSVFTCDTQTKVTMDSAVSACALITGLGTDPAADYTSLKLYCEPNYAELQYFDTPDASAADCSEDKWYQTANVTEECGFVLKTGDNKIFGQILECYGVSVASTHMPSGVPSAVPSTMPSMMPSKIPTSMPVPGNDTGNSNKNCNINHVLYCCMYLLLLLLCL